MLTGFFACRPLGSVWAKGYNLATGDDMMQVYEGLDTFEPCDQYIVLAQYGLFAFGVVRSLKQQVTFAPKVREMAIFAQLQKSTLCGDE